MKSFSFNRFCQTLRWTVGVNAHTLMLWFAGSAVGTFIGQMCQLTMFGDDNYAASVQNFGGFFSFCLVLVALVGLSSIFAAFNDKRRRESLLMLPATNLEKFLSAMIYVTVVWTLSIFIAFAAGDTLRALARMLLYRDPWLSSVPVMLGFITPGFSSGAFSFHFMMMEFVLFCAFVLWTHSAYTLGGIFLRKYAFTATSVAIVLLQIIVVRICKDGGVSMFSSNWENGVLVKEEVGAMAYVLTAVLTLLAVFNYWASFRIFKHFELITNKWTNYDIFKR